MARTSFFALLALIPFIAALPHEPPPKVDECCVVDFLVDILKIHGTADQFCRDLLCINPVTHVSTATKVPPPKVVTATIKHTDTHKETVTSVETDYYTVTDIVTATEVIPSTSIVAVTDVSTAVQTSTAYFTETDTITDDVIYTITSVDSETATAYETDTLTAFVTVTTYPPARVRARGAAPVPKPDYLQKFPHDQLVKACECLHVKPKTVTVVSTKTLPKATSTKHVTVQTTVTKIKTVDATTSIENDVYTTATVDVTSEVIATSTDFEATTVTSDITLTATADVTVDVTTSTQVAVVTSSATITDTVTQTTVETTITTATPVCGVNLVQNGDFPAPQWPPWSFTYSGGCDPQFNAECGIDTYCPLVYCTSAGSETWSQTINTYPGKTYTLSFELASFGTQGTAVAECYVDAAGASIVSGSPSTYTGATFHPHSGTFVASSEQTKITCTASTTSYIAVNFEAIHVIC